MTHRFTLSLLSLSLIGLGGSGCASTRHDDHAAVLSTVQGLFDAIEAKDADAAERLVIPAGSVVDVRPDPEDASSNRIRARTHQEFIAGLPSIESALLERMWNPTVMIEGDIAMVWTPYDFWVDGRFSHCGVDVFSLVRTDEGWRIATVAYTAQTEGCDESPLGPPRGMARTEAVRRTGP